jgi:hypothetical protein
MGKIRENLFIICHGLYEVIDGKGFIFFMAFLIGYGNFESFMILNAEIDGMPWLNRWSCS